MKRENYSIFQFWYQNLDWILDKCEKLPRNARFTLARRIADESIDIIELLTEAIYSPRKAKRPKLHRVNMKLEKLRVFFRICHDRKYISTKQYLYISERIDETGRMLGGWMKSL